MGYVTVTVDVCEVLEEVDDELLVQEIIDRELSRDVLAKILAAKGAGDKKITLATRRELTADLIGDLVAGRSKRALAAVDAVIATMVPIELLEAREAIMSGRVSDAVCMLDRFMEPSPAATATALPARSV